jgi:hypothetical protein
MRDEPSPRTHSSFGSPPKSHLRVLQQRSNGVDEAEDGFLNNL